MKIAVVPARGGSKRIPGKNTRELNGVPAIIDTLNKLKNSNLFDKILVSTDNELIADISSSTLFTEIIWRPSQLADDFTTTVEVIAHAITAYEDLHQQSTDFTCCVYPVNPFLRIDDLSMGLERIMKTACNYVNPVVKYPYPIQRSLVFDEDGILDFANPEYVATRTQDLEETFHDAGQWYWGRSLTWKRQSPLLRKIEGIEIPNWRAWDIDTEQDWEMALKLSTSMGFKN